MRKKLQNINLKQHASNQSKDRKNKTYTFCYSIRKDIQLTSQQLEANKRIFKNVKLPVPQQTV